MCVLYPFQLLFLLHNYYRPFLWWYSLEYGWKYKEMQNTILDPWLGRQNFHIKCKLRASLAAQMVKCLPAMRQTRVRSLGWEDPLEKEMATHSSTLAWKIPWTEEPGRLQSMGLQRVGHDWATSLSLSFKYIKGVFAVRCLGNLHLIYNKNILLIFTSP